MKNDLSKIINEDEEVLYEGKPNKVCYIFEGIFNPMLLFALMWFWFDFSFFKNFSSLGGVSNYTIMFMLVHLMPVWMYLFGIIFIARKYRNTRYVVTDKAVYISSGIFTMNYTMKPFAEIARVNLHRGIFDQVFGVGDVEVITSAEIANFNRNNGNNMPSYRRTVLESISNYDEVYNLVKKLQIDIYSDTMYPNDKRPEENHGYNTKYKG